MRPARGPAESATASLLFLLCACSLLQLLLLSPAAGVSAAPIRVHIVAHSHTDAGWLKTVDQSARNIAPQHSAAQRDMTTALLPRSSCQLY